MWNRSYYWQRQLRVAAGVCLLVAAAVGLIFLQRTAPARRVQAGAHDMLSELHSQSGQEIDVTVPASLRARAGNLVYRDRTDGMPQVIGRVVSVLPSASNKTNLRIRMTAPVTGTAELSGVLKGAPASLDLRDAISLLISPNTPEQELILARDTIWPSVRARLLPQIIDGLAREVAREMATLDEHDKALLADSFERMRTRLRPLEEQLVNRLSQRAWETVGVSGLASGIWNATADGVQNGRASAADWWLQLMGKPPRGEKIDRSFLNEETAQALQSALEEEAIAFWNENRAEILAALKSVVVEMRPEFEAAFKQRWAGMLYQRAILPAWQENQDVVLDAMQQYVNDFAARRLLTREGGPRLMFAYALRSSLDISDEPLLIFSQQDNPKTPGVVYESLLH
jgi:hypothetical protein